MSSAPIQTIKPPPETPPVPIPVVAALLSVAVPGLGHMVQGYLSGNFVRLCKGCLFLVALWGMFFYGFARSQWRNVYLPHVQEVYVEEDRASGRLFKSAHFMGKPLPTLLGNLWNRPQYIMQFWVGLPAWPAFWNYLFPDAPLFGTYQESPGTLTAQDNNSMFVRKNHLDKYEAEDNRIQKLEGMGRLWDIYWIYTVIAGALNLVVIYDAYAGPVRFKVASPKPPKRERKK